MARKSVFRRNAIKLGLIALGIIILFGLVASITDTFVIGFEAVPFTVPLPLSFDQFTKLALAENFAVDCRIWVEGDKIDINGNRRSIGFKTTTFNPQFELEIFNPQTETELVSIATEIHIRCDPGNTSGFEFGVESGGLISDYVLTGGTVDYHWEIEQEGGTAVKRFNISRATIQPADNVLQTSTGGGIILARPTILASTIDNNLESTKEVYFTSGKLVVTARPEFKFTLGCDARDEPRSPSFFQCAVSQNEFATVNLDAGFGTIKVINQIVDPPKPTSEAVNLVKLQTSCTEGGQTVTTCFSDSNVVDLEIRVQLPQWTSAEGSPTFSLFKPGQQSPIANDVLLTARKLIDDSTNTYEFFITRLDVPKSSDGKIEAGNWAVQVGHPGRSGEDIKGFTISARNNQADPNDTVTENKDDPDSSTNRQQVNGDDPEKKDGETFNFLAIGDLVKCFEGISNPDAFDCLNDEKFIPIFGIIAIVVLLSVVSGRRS